MATHNHENLNSVKEGFFFFLFFQFCDVAEVPIIHKMI
jgi:hypothetical protein